LVNTLFFSLSMGLWISARSWEQKKANSAAVWTAVGIMWLLPALAEVIEQKLRWPSLAAAIRVFSPSYQISKAKPFGIGMLRDSFWMSVAIVHGLGWLALWRTCVTVTRAWQDRPATPFGERFRDRWDGFWMGSRAGRESFRRRLVDLNPVHWLSARQRFGPVGVWVLLGFIFTVWFGMWSWIEAMSPGKGPPFWGIGIPIVFFAQIVLRAKTCSVAAEVLARDRLSGALELLLSTSLSLKEVAGGIWLTVRRFIWGPALATIVTGAVVFLYLTSDLGNHVDSRQVNVAWLMFLALTVSFLSDLVAGVWTSLWMSCLTRVPNGAGGMAMMRLLLLPWALFFLTASLASYFGFRRLFNEPENLFVVWFVYSFANSLFWMNYSKRKFFEGVRVAASERFLPPEAAGKFSWLPWRRKAAHGGG
jgi:hypothetical protein